MRPCADHPRYICFPSGLFTSYSGGRCCYCLASPPASVWAKCPLFGRNLHAYWTCARNESPRLESNGDARHECPVGAQLDTVDVTIDWQLQESIDLQVRRIRVNQTRAEVHSLRTAEVRFCIEAGVASPDEPVDLDEGMQ